jgi:hypothetical protein
MTVKEAGEKLDSLVRQSTGLNSLGLTEFLADKLQHLTMVAHFEFTWDEYPFDLVIAVDIKEIEKCSDDAVTNLLIRRCRIILADVINSCVNKLLVLLTEGK